VKNATIKSRSIQPVCGEVVVLLGTLHRLAASVSGYCTADCSEAPEGDRRRFGRACQKPSDFPTGKVRCVNVDATPNFDPLGMLEK
jgi:hypothetical protein